MRLQRLKTYWEAKSFATAKAFADFLGVSPSNFSELDKRGNPTRLLLALSLKTDLNIDWLLSGEGEMIAPASTQVEAVAEAQPAYGVRKNTAATGIPLYIADDAGKVISVMPDAVTPPGDVTAATAYALKVAGGAMARMYDAGSIVIASRESLPVAGNPVVVTFNDGRMLPRIFRQKDNLIILEAINPAAEPIICTRDDIRHMHRILWKREAD